jgi:hypothetical protein
LKALLPLFALLISACAVGPYASTPRYKEPASRTVAARQLNEALAFGARGMSEVAADQLKLTWNERRALTDKRSVLLERQLSFRAIRAVLRPERPGEWWELRIIATGGQVTFEFDDGATASKAEVALRRLATNLSDEEAYELVLPRFEVLDREVQAYRENESEDSAANLDWKRMLQSISDLELITGQEFGHDIEGVLDWHSFLGEAFSLGR